MDSFAAWNFKNLNWLEIGKIQKALSPEYREFQFLHVISYIIPNFYFARSKSNENHLQNWITSLYKVIITLGTMTLIFHFVSRAFWTFNRTSIQPNKKTKSEMKFYRVKNHKRKVYSGGIKKGLSVFTHSGYDRVTFLITDLWYILTVPD